MTIDLWWLAFTAMLTAALWIPYIACQVMTNGALAPANYGASGLPADVEACAKYFMAAEHFDSP